MSNKLSPCRCNLQASLLVIVNLLIQIIRPRSRTLLVDAISPSPIRGTLSPRTPEIEFQAQAAGAWDHLRRLTRHETREAVLHLLQINIWPTSTAHRSTTRSRSGLRRCKKAAGQPRGRRRALKTTSLTRSKALNRSLSQCKNFSVQTRM